MRIKNSLGALVVAAMALSITGVGVASATEISDYENSAVFCGFEEGDISDEELAEMGIDETFVIEYKTQEECDAETEAALAEAANDPNVDSDMDLPDPEPTEEPVVEDEVIETPVDEPIEEPVEVVTEIIDASVYVPSAAEVRVSFFGTDLF